MMASAEIADAAESFAFGGATTACMGMFTLPAFGYIGTHNIGRPMPNAKASAMGIMGFACAVALALFKYSPNSIPTLKVLLSVITLPTLLASSKTCRKVSVAEAG
jgi:hypothetical protein